MIVPTPDDGETTSFKIADRKIGNLLKQLDDKNVCPHCVARALAAHAAGWAECMICSAKAIELLESLIASLHENDVAAPDPLPSGQTH
jgi:hypothetical protein